MKNSFFNLIIGSLILAFAGISNAAQNTVTVDILVNGKMESLSSISSYIKIAKKYPDRVKLNLQFAADENLWSIDSWGEQIGRILFAFENSPENYQEYTDCLSMEWPNRFCDTIAGVDFTAFDQRGKGNWLKGYENNIVILAASDVRRKSLPAVTINGEGYTGRNLLADVVSAINTKLPKGHGLPKLSKGLVVEVYAIGETTGMAARDLQWEASLAKLPYIKVVPLMPNSSIAKKLMKDAGVTAYPAYLVLKEKNETSEFEAISAKNIFAFDAMPKGMAAIYPRSGIAVKEVAGAKAKGNELDIYIMSQCPFGVRAQSAVLKNLDKEGMPEKVNFKYIVNKNAQQKWKSLHGQAEVDENIRQLTIQKLYPEKFSAYVLERAKDFKSDKWTDAATKAGLDIESVKASLKQGELVLEQNMADVYKMSINASPTFVWQGKYILSGQKALKAALGVDPFSQ